MRTTNAILRAGARCLILVCGGALGSACADKGPGSMSPGLGRASVAGAMAGASAPQARSADAGHAKDAATKDAGAPMVTISGTLTDFKTKEQISGASMCLTMPAQEPMPCATSAADGAYSLPIPVATDVAVAFHADGYFDQLVLERVSHDVHLNLEPVTTDYLKMQAASVGATLDDGAGILALNASIAGISFSVSPASGTLVYYDSSGQPSKSATQTSMPGLGVVFGLKPGDYEMTYQGASQGCVIADLGWPGSAQSQARALVMANSISEVGMTCL